MSATVWMILGVFLLGLGIGLMAGLLLTGAATDDRYDGDLDVVDE
jgi:hypothetical protein